MRKVLVCNTSGVDAQEALAVEAGVRQVLEYVPVEFQVDIMATACNADAWQQRCLQQSQTDLRFGPQVFEDCLFKKLIFSLTEYAARRGQTLADWGLLGVLTVDADLTSRDNGFLFGATRDKTEAAPAAISMLSVSRLRAITSAELRAKVLQRLARHEFGHALGLIPQGRQSNVEDKIGLHCTNVCTMRQGMSLPQVEALTREENQRGVVFCSECADHLSNAGRDSEPRVGGRT